MDEKWLMLAASAAGSQGDAVPQGTDLAEGTQVCQMSARRRDGCVELEGGNKSTLFCILHAFKQTEIRCSPSLYLQENV